MPTVATQPAPMMHPSNGMAIGSNMSLASWWFWSAVALFLSRLVLKHHLVYGHCLVLSWGNFLNVMVIVSLLMEG